MTASQYRAVKPFAEAVREVVKRIPVGCVLTYGDVAKLADSPGAARAVGTVMRQNYDPSVPCHRVVKASGEVGEYNRAGGEKTKAQRLTAEGVDVQNALQHRWWGVH